MLGNGVGERPGIAGHCDADRDLRKRDFIGAGIDKLNEARILKQRYFSGKNFICRKTQGNDNVCVCKQPASAAARFLLEEANLCQAGQNLFENFPLFRSGFVGHKKGWLHIL